MMALNDHSSVFPGKEKKRNYTIRDDDVITLKNTGSVNNQTIQNVLWPINKTSVVLLLHSTLR